MATPTKAFTDPTGLSAFMRGPSRSGAAGVLVALLPPNPPAPRPFAPSASIPALSMVKESVVANPGTPKVPDPPFGRSIVITFPVIYRERPAPPVPDIPPPPIINPDALAHATSNRLRMTYTSADAKLTIEPIFPVADVDRKTEPTL